MTGLAMRPRRHEQVLARQGDRALILLNPHSGHYYTLDEVGSRVWDLCDGSCTVEQMVATISLEYDAPSKVIEADLLDLLTDLASERLVVERH